MARHLDRATGEPAIVCVPQKAPKFAKPGPFHPNDVDFHSPPTDLNLVQAVKQVLTADSGPCRDLSRSEMEGLHVLKRSSSKFTSSPAPPMLFMALRKSNPQFEETVDGE